MFSHLMGFLGLGETVANTPFSAEENSTKNPPFLYKNIPLKIHYSLGKIILE